MVYPISDSTTEIIIRRHIEGIQKLLNPQYGNTTTTPEEEAAGLAVIIMNNPATEQRFELQIKTLQNAPRDPDKLRAFLKVKQRQYEEAAHAEEIQSLVTEIEMLQFVLFLVSRNERKEDTPSTKQIP